MAEDQTQEALKSAVADGIKEALRDPETVGTFWDATLRTFQSRAQQNTGKAVLGGVGVVLKRGVIFALAGYAVYLVGGWTALAKFVSLFWPS